VPDALAGFARTSFTHDGETRAVHRTGTGPAVIVISEIPGITPDQAGFGRKVADRGLTAVMPHMFGEDGRAPSPGYIAASITRACIAREFTVLARGATSPVIGWLRALAAHEHQTCGGPGVGAVGMCFTGGFALGMMVDDIMLAPVLSQPSLPIGLSKKKKADIHLSPDDLATVKRRVIDDGVCVIGMRFTGDRLVPAERFETLRRELGDGFIGVEIDSSKGNPHGHRGAAHSVLTEDLIDEPGQPTHEALHQVLDFFVERLI